MGSALSRNTVENVEEANESLQPAAATAGDAPKDAGAHAGRAMQANNLSPQRQLRLRGKETLSAGHPAQQQSPQRRTGAPPSAHKGPGSPLRSDGQPRRHVSIAELSAVPETPVPVSAAPAAKQGAPSDDTPATAPDLARPKRKQASASVTGEESTQKRKKPNHSLWTYVGLQYGNPADVHDRKRLGWVECPDGRCYPREATRKKGDIPVEVYTQEDYDNDAEYEVENILDERRRGSIVQYRVKWKGYELDPQEFVTRKALEDCEALDRWEAAQAAASSTSRQLDLMNN